MYSILQTAWCSSSNGTASLDFFLVTVEKILKGSLDSILSPTPWRSVKVQIMGGKSVNGKSV